MTEARHHYRESGLSNVYLINGFRYVETPYGRSVIIEDLDGCIVPSANSSLARRRA